MGSVPQGTDPFYLSGVFLYLYYELTNPEPMKRTLFFLAAVAVAISVSLNAFASEPDKPGTKLITIQGGYGPGIAAVLSGNIAMANLGASHLYGGLQLGGNFRHGKVAETRKTDLSVAPRLTLGWNLGRVVEIHAGGLAGIAAVKFDADQSNLAFCWGGFGGLRLNFSDSFGLVLEGCYSKQLPYGLAGIAFKF